jgi:hypothetical protein
MTTVMPENDAEYLRDWVTGGGEQFKREAF